MFDFVTFSAEYSVEEIVYCGMYYMQKLTSVVLPSTLKTIAEDGFLYSSGKLQSITMPNSNPYFTQKNGCFIQGDKIVLTQPTAKIPTDSTITKIGRQAFSNCAGEYVIPSNITHIGEAAFNDSSVTSLTIEAFSCGTRSIGISFSCEYKNPFLRLILL